MAHAAHSAKHHGHHIIPMKVLLRVFLGLVALTVFTVLTAQLDLGALNVPLALAIALTKASLVLTFFMALKYDNRVNTLTFAIGTLFVLIFIVFTLFDTAFRGDLDNVNAQTIMDEERAEEERLNRDAGAERLPLATPSENLTDPLSATDDTTAAEAADTTSAQAPPADTSEAAPQDH